VPKGLVTLTTALPDPSEQSTVCVGLAGDAGCAGITTFNDDDEVHPAELVTVKVYVPDGTPEIVALVPVPEVVIPPGVRVSVHVPVDGKPLNTTLPVGTEQVGLVIVPTTGAVGFELTDKLYVAFAATQDDPEGLSVVTVIMTDFPRSPFFGV
jgi:hypothetical protein